MTEILKIPFNRSYWVVPGKLHAGGYPGSEDPMKEERKFIITGIKWMTGLKNLVMILEIIRKNCRVSQ